MINCNKYSRQLIESFSSGNDASEFRTTILQNVLEAAFDDKWFIELNDFENFE